MLTNISPFSYHVWITLRHFTLCADAPALVGTWVLGNLASSKLSVLFPPPKERTQTLHPVPSFQYKRQQTEKENVIISSPAIHLHPFRRSHKPTPTTAQNTSRRPPTTSSPSSKHIHIKQRAHPPTQPYTTIQPTTPRPVRALDPRYSS